MTLVPYGSFRYRLLTVKCSLSRCVEKVDWKKTTHHFQFFSFKHMDLRVLEKMARSGSSADLLKLYICQMMMTWYCVNILNKIRWCFAKCTSVLVMWLLSLTRRMEFPTFNSMLDITLMKVDRMLTLQELLNAWGLTVRKKKSLIFWKLSPTWDTATILSACV